MRRHRLAYNLAWVVAALAWLVLPARAQRNYCTITQVTARRLVNAVQITVQADGIMEVGYDAASFYDPEALRQGRWQDAPKPVSAIGLRVRNARSRLGALADVGVYPASHVELSVPAEAPDSVDLSIVMFTPVRVLSIQLPEADEFPDMGLGPTAALSISPDRTRITIVVTSDRRTQAALVRRTPRPTDPVELSVFGDETGVAVEALNANLRDVARALSHSTGRDVRVAGDVARAVSLSLPPTPLDNALEAIGAAYGLSVNRENGAVVWAEGFPDSGLAYGATVVEAVPLQYITPSAARGALPDFLLRHVRVDATQNALTVFGPRALVNKLRADLQTLDRPAPMFEVEATVVEFTSSDLAETFLSGENLSGRDRVTWRTDTGDIRFFRGGPAPERFSADLRALESAGRVRIHARPRATALNGQTARLFVGQRKYIKIVYFDALEEAYSSRAMAVDLGVTLRCTPTSGGGPEVTLDIEPDVSSIAALEPGTGLPTVARRNARATLRVRPGDTVAIGGLAMDQPERHRRKIPLLGDLPLIGRLFQFRQRVRERAETMMFVTLREASRAPATPLGAGEKAT